MKVSMRLAAVLLASSLAALAGDLTLTMAGKGKYNDGPQTQLWSSKFMRMNNPGSQIDTLVDYENGINYTIEHKKKTIQRFSWDDMEAAVEAMAESMKNLPAFALKLMGGGDGEVTVEDLGKEAVVGRTCRKWKITAGKMVFETSNDPSLKPPIPAVSYQRFLKVRNLVGAMGPAASQMRKVGEEMSKIQGVALKTRTVLPIVGEVTSEATEVKEGPIPANSFALPEGYKMEDAGKKMREQMAKGR